MAKWKIEMELDKATLQVAGQLEADLFALRDKVNSETDAALVVKRFSQMREQRTQGKG